MTDSDGVKIVLHLLLLHLVDLHPVPDLDEPPLHILGGHGGASGDEAQVRVGGDWAFQEQGCKLLECISTY